MSERRIRHVIAAFGSDLRRWPDKERGEARNLLMRDRAAAWEELAAARRLDARLDRLPALTPTPGLAALILARAAALPQEAAPSRPAAAPAAPVPGILARLRDMLAPGPLWPQLAGLTAAAAFGFFIGMSGIVNFDSSSNMPSSVASYDVGDFSGVL